LYTNRSDDFSNTVEVLYLAQKYVVPELVTVCVHLLRIGIHLGNAISTYQASIMFDQPELKHVAMSFMLK
jgi:hypothetical protein